MIRSLKEEVDALRRQLAEAGGAATAVPMSDEERQRMRAEIEAKVKAELGGGDGWEARLAETRRRAEEAARELSELGVVTGPERDAQLARAAAGEPHFVNLHEDAQLSGQVLHFFPAKPGTGASPAGASSTTTTGSSKGLLVGSLRLLAGSSKLLAGGSSKGLGSAAAASPDVFRIGRRDAAPSPQLKLGGASIQREHARVAWSPDGSCLLLSPATPGAKVFIDGEPVTKPTPLVHKCRVVFGASHAFVFLAPPPQEKAPTSGTGVGVDAAAGLPEGTTTNGSAAVAPESGIPPGIDYAFALGELNKAQAESMAAEVAARRAELEEERRHAAERIAAMEAKMASERATAAAESASKIRAFEERAASYAGNEVLVAALRAEQAKQAEAAAARTAELEAALAAQVAAAESQRRRKERELRERSVLDEQLLRTIPLVNEANAMSEEMGRGLVFEPKLLAVAAAAGGRRASQTSVDTAGEAGGVGGGGDSRASTDTSAASNNSRLTDIFVRVSSSSGGGGGGLQQQHVLSGGNSGGAAAASSGGVGLWVLDKFTNRLYMMREVYAAWGDAGRPPLSQMSLTSLPGVESDPFYDPPEDTLIGRCTVFLDPLQYSLGIAEATPIIDYKGHEHGELKVRITPHRWRAGSAAPLTTTTTTTTAASINSDGGGSADVQATGSPRGGVGGGRTGTLPPHPAEDLDTENLSDLKGSRISITVDVESARGLPAALAHAPSVRFQFFLEEDVRRSDAVAVTASPSAFSASTTSLAAKGMQLTTPATTAASAAQMNPVFAWRSVFTPVVSDELLRYVASEALDFEVWGRRADPNAATGGGGGSKGLHSEGSGGGGASPSSSPTSLASPQAAVRADARMGGPLHTAAPAVATTYIAASNFCDVDDAAVGVVESGDATASVTPAVPAATTVLGSSHDAAASGAAGNASSTVGGGGAVTDALSSSSITGAALMPPSLQPQAQPAPLLGTQREAVLSALEEGTQADISTPPLVTAVLGGDALTPAGSFEEAAALENGLPTPAEYKLVEVKAAHRCGGCAVQ